MPTAPAPRVAGYRHRRTGEGSSVLAEGVLDPGQAVAGVEVRGGAEGAVHVEVAERGVALRVGRGDGRDDETGGVGYDKGLGVHAEGAVEYHAGETCEKVTTDVGVDDEKGARVTVTFEIWADGTKVASTGALTNAMPAQPLTADVTGAQLIRLVVTDADDGIDSDHADWADARLTC
jgi:hypothetical protein